MTGTNITALGLVFDIIGALVIWHYVAEINFADKADYLKGNATLILADPNPEQIRSYKWKILMSRIGIALLITGFCLQLIGNYFPKAVAVC